MTWKKYPPIREWAVWRHNVSTCLEEASYSCDNKFCKEIMTHNVLTVLQSTTIHKKVCSIREEARDNPRNDALTGTSASFPIRMLTGPFSMGNTQAVTIPDSISNNAKSVMLLSTGFKSWVMLGVCHIPKEKWIHEIWKKNLAPGAQRAETDDNYHKKGTDWLQTLYLNKAS